MKTWALDDRNIVIFPEPKRLIVFDSEDSTGEQWLKDNGIDSNTITKTIKPEGKHYYLRLPKGVEDLRTRIRFLGLPLDIKVTGHVVAPGSVVDGKQYDWLKGPRQVALLPECPAQVVQMIREDMQRVVVPKAIPQLSSTAGTNRRPDIKFPDRFAMKIESIQGQGGSKRLVRVVTMLRMGARRNLFVRPKHLEPRHGKAAVG